jgi:hypothetical protein
MKSIQIYIAIILIVGGITLTSCDKGLLDVTPPSQLSTSIFWKTPKDADLALTGLYNYLYAGGGTYATGEYQPYVWDNFSDNSYGQYDYGGGTTALTAGLTPQSSGYPNTVYTNNYQAIAAINSFLANVGKVLSGDQLKAYKGQAFFLRAFNYWWLAKLYGNVPIVKENPFNISYKAHMATSPRDSVLMFVESDLDSAIAYLPNVPYTDGHAVKGTAEGYMVRVLLFEKQFKQAAAMAQQVMQQKQFSLNPCYACNFYKPDQTSSKEIMFSVKYQAPTIQHPDGVSSALHLQEWKGELGTQDLINSYEMANGKSIIDPGSGYNSNSPWSNRDPRMRMTFFFPGDTKAQGWFNTNYPVATPGQDSWINGYYCVKKWLTPGITNPDYGTIDDNDFVLLRYAGVLLMYAEAQNEAMGPDPSVYQAIDEVRGRVGMPDLPLGMNQDQMRQAIRGERRVEFAMEGIRYFDLRRWGIASQVLNGFVQNPLFPDVKAKYKPNYDFWPIPQYEIDFNAPEMKQNAGY